MKNNADKSVWGSLAASLEEECEGIVFNCNGETTRSNSNGDPNLSLGGIGSGEKGTLMGSGMNEFGELLGTGDEVPAPMRGISKNHTNTNGLLLSRVMQGQSAGRNGFGELLGNEGAAPALSLSRVKQAQASDASNHAVSKNNPPISIHLRPWIKHALQAAGGNNDRRAAVSSLVYLKASIKIAVALTERLSKAEELDKKSGNSNKLDLLTSSDLDWANHVMVHLQNGEGEQVRDLNKEVTAFFEVFEKNRGQHAIKAEDIINQTEDDTDVQFKSMYPKTCDPEESKVHEGSNSLTGLFSTAQDTGNISDIDKQMEFANFKTSGLDEFEEQESRERLKSTTLLDSDVDEFDRKEGPNEMELTSEMLGEDQKSDEFGRTEAQYQWGSTFTRDGYNLKSQIARQLGPGCVEKLDDRDGPYQMGLESVTVGVDQIDQKPPSNYDSTSLQSEVPEYLQVDTATFQCQETEQSAGTIGTYDAVKDERLRLFHLGLVLYELFSGGERPPPDLIALASCDAKFMSLSAMTLVKEKADDDSQDNCRNSKRHQGPSQPGNKTNAGLCEIYCEYLKLTGVPGPLCNLIFNLLDTVHGDCCGNECYTEMDQVTCDLRLMMDNPFKYLKDLDMNKLQLYGLDLDKFFISREEEFECIKSSYSRFTLGSSELVIIKGESGSGKTWLAHHVGRFIAQEGGIFLSAKFDQMRQGGKPLAVLSSAFDQYCEVLIWERETDWAKAVINDLTSTLGQEDAGYLVNMIPKLCHILDTSESTADFDINQNCRNAMQRLYFLFGRFIEVITKSNRFITLFLDDLQWADGTSIIYLEKLLNHKNIFFIGSSRDDDKIAMSDHPFWKMIQNLQTSIGMNVTTVRLNCMNQNELNVVISDLLCLLPRTVRSLSNMMYIKTKGNALFFSQLMTSLSRDKLIYLDTARHRWMWDEEAIHSVKLPDDVAVHFMDGISKLPSDVQSALRSLSIFGSVKSQYLMLLESGLDLKLREPLDVALAEGLVNFVNESYHFSHDRILEVSYDMMEEQHRRCTHLSYGSCLVKIALDTGDDDLLFISVDQINFGGPSALVPERGESDRAAYFDMASHNMTAGKRAMAMSQFASAYEYFNHGISFLRKNCWRDHYGFSLEIFQLASKCALATGDTQGLGILTDQVLHRAHCFEDELDTRLIIISSLINASDMVKALETGLAFLSQLGEGMPSYSSQVARDHALTQEIQGIQSLLRGKTEEALMNLPTMSDVRKQMTIEVLNLLQAIAHQAKPEVLPFLLLKSVRITLSCGELSRILKSILQEHVSQVVFFLLKGLSPAAPFSFACFGLFLAKLDDITGARRFTLLARSLTDKLGFRQAAGAVICLLAHVQCYIQPLSATLELWVHGESASLSVGDSFWACTNRIESCIGSFWAGLYLPDVEEKVSEACKLVKKLEVKVRVEILLLIQSAVKLLKGVTSISASHGLLSDCNNITPRTKMFLAIHRLYISYMFDQENLIECLKSFFESEVITHALLFFNSVYTFIAGLASFRVFRETRDISWQDRCRKSKAQMELWSKHGAWNFEHKLKLFEAEEHYCNGNLESAKESFKSSILSARTHKFIHDEALACELAAKFYLETGDSSLSLEHFILAHEKYKEWGASGKANSLFDFVRSRFPNLSTAAMSS